MPLSAEILARLAARQTASADFGSPQTNPVIEGKIAIGDGVDAFEADILWTDERTVNASTTDAIDLAGVLSDAFGQTVAAVELVAVMVINKPKASNAPANVSSLTVGGGSNPAIPNALPALGPGGMLLLADPDGDGIGAVSPGTGDLLNVANGAGGTATYQVAVLARTA